MWCYQCRGIRKPRGAFARYCKRCEKRYASVEFSDENIMELERVGTRGALLGAEGLPRAE